MARSIGNTIGDSLQLGLGYAERLLAGIEASQFARLARPGGHAVESNHAAFALGHLAIYPPKMLLELQRDPAAIALPDGFEPLFVKESRCEDDVDGSIYPAMEVIRSAFFNGYQAALEVYRDVPDEQLAGPNPRGGAMAERFPTVGSMHMFYSGGHLMMHLGQISAWRRMMGLGPA